MFVCKLGFKFIVLWVFVGVVIKRVDKLWVNILIVFFFVFLCKFVINLVLRCSNVLIF